MNSQHEAAAVSPTLPIGGSRSGRAAWPRHSGGLVLGHDAPRTFDEATVATVRTVDRRGRRPASIAPAVPRHMQRGGPARKRILYLTPRLPYPPNKGDKIRSHRWLTSLAERHDVYLGSFVDDPADAAHVPHVESLCRDVAVVPFSRGRKWWKAAAGLCRELTGVAGPPITVSAYDDRRMRQALTAWRRLTEFDAVLAFSSAMAAYALQVPARRRVLDLCDCDSQKWLEYSQRLEQLRGWRPARAAAWAFRREADALRRAEWSWLGRFDRVVVVNQRERRLLARIADESMLSVVGNGAALPEPSPPAAEPVVGFVGALDYPPNLDGLQWFVRHAWPLVRRTHPAARLRIVGRAPTRGVRALASVAGVDVIGEVADLAPHYAAMRACIAPLRIARGVQNKVLEAMAFGRPVVVTSAAADGMDAEAGRRLLTADQPEWFAAQLCRLLSSYELCEQIGRAAREHIRARYDWLDSTSQMERILLEAPSPFRAFTA